MPDYIENFHDVLRSGHVALGFGGLVLFWVPIFARKGGRLHVLGGRAFAVCATLVAFSGLVASLWALIHPASFLGAKDTTSDAYAQAVTNLRFVFSLMVFLSLGVLSGLTYGLRLVRTRRAPEQLGHPLLRMLFVTFAVAAVYLAGFGGWHMLSEAQVVYALPLILGLLGIWGVREDLAALRRPPTEPDAWLYGHMEQMLHVGIGFYTAFFIFGAREILELTWSGPARLAVWLIPVAIGLPATGAWIRVVRRKSSSLPK